MDRVNTTATDYELGRERADMNFAGLHEPPSAVAWGAIVAGAAAAAALSLILLMLGVGLGLSAVSPWAPGGISASSFGVSTILWITATQILAAGMGGFLAGRLRSAWTDAHGDEVYFRDSAHGFLAWAVASLATAALLTSAIGGILGSGTQAVAAAASLPGAVKTADAELAGTVNYAVDTLWRPTGATPAPTAGTAPSAEVSRILLNALGSGALPSADLHYLGQRVAERTGLAPAEAEARVTAVHAQLQTRLRTAETQAREAADKARKASAYGALWLFIALLIGAFIASVSAIFGGRQRDL